MAALLRCAARRLGGSLLRQTQAAERRLLVRPSRLMHTGGEHAHAELTREIQQKKKEMHDVISKWEKDSVTIGAAQHLSIQVTPRPHDSHSYAPLSYQSNNTHVRNLTSKLEQMKQEMYDAISRSNKVTLGGRTYNIRESNNRRLVRLAKGVTAAVKDTVFLAFCILFITLETGAIVFEVSFCLLLFASPIVFIIKGMGDKSQTITSEDKIIENQR